MLVPCCSYKSGLQLPCDFDVMRKSFIGSSIFMRFLFNQNKAEERPGRQHRKGSSRPNEVHIGTSDSVSCET